MGKVPEALQSSVVLLATYRDIIICIASSALAGIGVGFFSCLLSSADKQRQLNGGKHTDRSRIRCVLGAIGSTIFGILSLVGLAYGPVALVVVVRAGATLPANALFSQVFQIRPLTSSDALGTLVTLSGVVCFTLFQGDPGPEVTVGVFLKFIQRPAAIVVVGALLLALLVSVLYMLRERIRARSCLLRRRHRSGNWPMFAGRLKRGERSERSERSNFPGRVERELEEVRSSDEDSRPRTRQFWRQDTMEVLAVCTVTSTSSAAMDVAAKGWAAPLKLGPGPALQSQLFWISVVCNLVFLVGMRAGTIIGCHRCDVLLFIPCSTVMNIFVSVATGLVVLEEWKEVKSWTGLASSSLTVLGGIIMLVTGPAEGDTERSTRSTESSDSEKLEEEVETGSEVEEAGICDAVEIDGSDLDDPQEVPSAATVSFSSLLYTHKMHALASMNKNHSRAAFYRDYMQKGLRALRPEMRVASAPDLGALERPPG
ncbi:unnamed protein product [Symbiodinium natans]|uniref:Uncharacterized protein n=1 Tax=Symbiodinium natans TaxID=878477 RepID=A0A812TR73_9DINO|nr:unnamed protein product [Symbiodinium natans]